MRIPLIVSFDSRVNKKGPVVYLSDGFWCLKGNHRDDTLVILENIKTPCRDLNRFKGDCTAQVEFSSESKDMAVTIYAEKID